jgi:hypothetical protein
MGISTQLKSQIMFFLYLILGYYYNFYTLRALWLKEEQ